MRYFNTPGRENRDVHHRDGIRRRGGENPRARDATTRWEQSVVPMEGQSLRWDDRPSTLCTPSSVRFLDVQNIRCMCSLPPLSLGQQPMTASIINVVPAPHLLLPTPGIHKALLLCCRLTLFSSRFFRSPSPSYFHRLPPAAASKWPPRMSNCAMIPRGSTMPSI